MSRQRARLLLPGLTLLWGCVYYNGLYNAQRVFDEAERLDRMGRHAEARERYGEALLRAAESYRKDREGRWADDALYIVGRCYLRQGELLRAGEAFARALELTGDRDLRRSATLYQGAVLALTGSPQAGLMRINDAIRELSAGARRGEGHLWRARALFSTGRVQEALWDLDRAGEQDPRLAATAALERLGWGLALDDPGLAGAGARAILTTAEGAFLSDTLEALVLLGSESWGPRVAVALLEGLDRAPWPGEARARALLFRASLAAEAGDTAAATVDAQRVAAGSGARATEGRIWLVRMLAGAATSIEDLADLRPLLLPAIGDSDALGLLETFRQLELLELHAERRDPTVALFAAAELARDHLGAYALAADMFVRYADLDPASPWSGKALLAARSLLPQGDRREHLRRRVSRMSSNPYVRIANRDPVPRAEFERLERELAQALSAVLAASVAAAVERDVLARERTDTLHEPSQ